MKIPFYTVRKTKRSKYRPARWNGYWFMGYIEGTVKIGEKVIVNEQEVTILEIKDQYKQKISMDESERGMKHWMKFDEEFNIDYYESDGTKLTALIKQIK